MWQKINNIRSIVILLLVVLATTLYATKDKINQFVIDQLTPSIDTFSAIDTDAHKEVNNSTMDTNNLENRILYFYITVRKGDKSDNTDHTFEEVNGNLYEGDMPIKAESIIQQGDEKGPLPGMLGYNELLTNSVIEQRALSLDKVLPQKSFKISFFERTGLWNGINTLALNKHVGDSLRIRNKLCFDLMQQIPQLPASKTNFVRLFIKDETENPIETSFVDYGVFTQIETVNKTFLRNHSLEPEGQLYKALDFWFAQTNGYEGILESKGSNDLDKLNNMLKAVNDYNIPINNTIDTYFDRENYMSWLAFNLLVGNKTTVNENFYLYSPSSLDTFYFIPWDYDNTLNTIERKAMGKINPGFKNGVANYWNVPLHKRFLMEKENREELNKKIDEIYAYISPTKMRDQLAKYKDIIENEIPTMPDLNHLKVTKGNLGAMIDNLPYELEENYNEYKKSMVNLMPFFVNEPTLKDGKIYLSWQPSHSFNDEKILYDLKIGTDWALQGIVTEISNLSDTEFSISVQEAGSYFLQITAKDSLGKRQISYDTYINATGDKVYGIKRYDITPDGRLLVTPSYDTIPVLIP